MADISKIKLPNNVTYDVESIGAAVTYTDPGTGTNLSEGYFLGVIPVALDRISVTTPPTKTTYYDGDTLDLTGIVVTAIYNNGNTEVVTSSCTYSPAGGSELSTTDTSITVTYQGFTTTQSITVTVPPIYGVEWDGSSSPAMTRTDGAVNFVDPVAQMSDGNGGWTQGSSPFDIIMPWAGMERVTDANVGVLVKIPKFWYKWTRNSTTMKLQISPVQQTETGWLVSPAHADRGDGVGERNYVYVGAYPCAKGGDVTTEYRSLSDILPLRSGGFPEGATKIHELGTDIWVWDYATYWTVAMLYLVEYASWNSQATIGHGGKARSNTGACDNMTYHTGTDATTKTTPSHVRYRYIEDMWSNVYNYCSGFVTYNKYTMANNDPSKSYEFTQDLSALVTIDNPKATGSGVIKSFSEPSVSGYEYALSPNDFKQYTSDADCETYVCDICSMPPNNTTGGVRYFAIGVSSNIDDTSCQFGLFRFNFVMSTGMSFSTRLMKLPTNV